MSEKCTFKKNTLLLKNANHHLMMQYCLLFGKNVVSVK